MKKLSETSKIPIVFTADNVEANTGKESLFARLILYDANSLFAKVCFESAYWTRMFYFRVPLAVKLFY